MASNVSLKEFYVQLVNMRTKKAIDDDRTRMPTTQQLVRKGRRTPAGTVGRELSRLLDDRTACAAASRVSREVSQERGSERAAELIEAALR